MQAIVFLFPPQSPSLLPKREGAGSRRKTNQSWHTYFFALYIFSRLILCNLQLRSWKRSPVAAIGQIEKGVKKTASVWFWKGETRAHANNGINSKECTCRFGNFMANELTTNVRWACLFETKGVRASLTATTFHFFTSNTQRTWYKLMQWYIIHKFTTAFLIYYYYYF